MKRFLVLLFSLVTLSVSLEAHKDEKIKLSEEYYSNDVFRKRVDMTPKYSIGDTMGSSLVDSNSGFPLNVVVEEATGTWCGYCPSGIVMCEYIREHYSDRIFPIAVHQGDKMEIDEYSDFLRDVSYFPSAFVNRNTEMQISTAEADLLYNQIKDKLTYAQVDLYAKLENNVLYIDSEAEFAVNMDIEHRLAFVVVEDSVGPYMQTNYYTPADTGLGFWETAGSRAKYYFDNVVRHIKTFDGIENSLPNNLMAGKKYHYSTTIELTRVDSPECKVIAMIINCKTGEIVNSSQYSVKTSQGLYLNKGNLNMLIGEREELRAYLNGSPIDNDNSVWKSSNERVVTVDNKGNLEAVNEGSAIITISYGTESAQCQVYVSMIGSIFEIEGIRYRISDANTCMVAIPDEGEYYMMEKIIIPAEIEVMGRSFVVNELEFSLERFVGAFCHCPNLTEIELPATITYLPGDVFEYCQQLREFRVPSSVWFIDAYAFNGCTNLSNLILNEGLTGLWTWSCAWCDNLKNIVLPSTLQTMGREVFYGTHPYWIHCKASVPPTLQGDLFNDEFASEDYSECALIVPESSINAYKESEYWNKFEIIVPDDVILNRYKLNMNPRDEFQLEVVDSDDNTVTWSCSNTEIASVDSEGNVTALAAGETTIIAECKGKIAECKVIISYEGQFVISNDLWYEIKKNNTCSVIKNLSSDDPYSLKEVIIPSEIFVSGQRIEVTEIAHDAFSNCRDMAQISLPNSIRILGAGSFWGCPGLSEIVLNEGLAEIERFSFTDCGNLKNIVLPSTLETMGVEVFAGVAPDRIQCKALVPPAVDRDLFDVSSISSVYSECALIVPESSVDAYRESEYWNRFEIIVPGDVILSNYKLQMNPGDMVKVNVLNSDDMPVTWSCSNTEIAGVDSEGNITAISTGETLVSAECNGKTAVCMIRVSMDGLCEKIDGLWYRITDSSNCEVISPNNEEIYEFEEFSIPPSVEILGNEYMVSSIGYEAFHSCPNLKQISIPNTVKRIGNCCFEHCFELVEVQLPLSLSSIGEYAFQGCCNLSKIDFPEQLNEIGRVAFGG
ncbi:MAG: leucine-rich repeat protein, partial [Muribaculaceae bacterium]|nr:leucine-rich repeat protein [Muribaculaceae bacterium]